LSFLKDFFCYRAKQKILNQVVENFRD
jgi:hypothetical protein